MRELSLFTGAGGGLLGTKLLGWEPIGYVEFNDYCQRVIKQRILDGFLPNAPIFGDIRTFISEGYAEAYQGLVDVVTGGFPCQPFSNAGKRLGADDPRNMWPSTIDCIRIIRPRYAFLENVPGLVTSGYFGTILSDLHQSGYDCRWRILSAAEMGAPHQRDRLWIVAEQRNFLSHPEHDWYGWREQQPESFKKTISENTNTTSNGNGGLSIRPRRSQQATPHTNGLGENVPNAYSQRLEKRNATPVTNQSRQSAGGVTAGRGVTWWEAEPDVGRVVDGVGFRVDRLRAIGNGQVPAVAATAWKLLSE